MAKQKNEAIVKDDEKKVETEVAIDAPKTEDTVDEKADSAPVKKDSYGYSQFAQFPVEMTIPMRVLAEAGISNRRYQILTSGQEVPEPIIRWMRKDVRYHRWFA